MRLGRFAALAAGCVSAAVALSVPAVSPSSADVLTAAAVTSSTTASGVLAAGDLPPNTLIVITDDMRLDEMRYVPKTNAWLSQRGMTFANGYSPTPMCCPARATLLTGQYAHNTGVYSNGSGGLHAGGVSAFDDSQTLATVLNDGLGDDNITTGYIGKYLNGYKAYGGEVRGTYVPPGWDVWRAGIAGEYRYQGITTYSFDGRYVDIGGYITTVETRLATNFIKQHSGNTPWTLVLNYFAPHNNVSPRTKIPIPQLIHAHDYDGARAPRGVAYNERDMSDKPPVVQRRRMDAQSRHFTDRLTEARYEALASVDDGMMRLQQALIDAGVEANTNIIFVSDNGYLLGDHRIPHMKMYGYEPSAKVPFLVSGGGFPAGATSGVPVGLHDVASTVTRWYGIGDMPNADGVSLGDVAANLTSQRDILLQGVFNPVERDYTALRTPDDWKYVEYASGDTELYNLGTDPTEVNNLSDRPAYAAIKAQFAQRLAELRDCAGETCR